MPWVVDSTPNPKAKKGPSQGAFTGNWEVSPPAAPPKRGNTPPPKRSYAASEVPLEALKNLPGSLKGVGMDALKALIHPVETGAGLGQLVAGGANLLGPEGGVPAVQRNPPAPGSEKYVMGAQDPTGYPTGAPTKFEVAGSTGEQEARSLGQMLAEQYGGWENIKRTMAEDPAVPLLDALTLATGGGAAAERLPGMFGRMGRAAAAPGRAVSRAGARAVQAPLDYAGKKLYGSALKKYLPADIGFEGQRRAIEAGRGGGYTFDEKGFNRLKNDISGKSAELDSIIATAEKQGKQVEFTRIWDSLDDLSGSARTSSLKPVDLQRKIENIRMQHEAFAPLEGPNVYTPSEALDLKRSLAREADYAQTPGSGVGTNEQRVAKTAARSAKEALEDLDPRINPLNQELVPLLTAEKPIYSAAIEGRTMSPHPIGGAAAARLATPRAISPAASLMALFYSPKLMAKHGILATQAGRSPFLEALLKTAPPASYVAGRVKPKKDKK